MRRREFISLLGGTALAWPLAAHAQQMRRIGVLISYSENNPEAQAYVAAFRDGLQKYGWQEGRNVQIDYRWAAGDIDRFKSSAAELVRLTPELLFVTGSTALEAVRQETSTIPIVFVQVADPVGLGFVASLAHPGGNITGFSHFEFSIGGKWLELLKEIAPRVTRVAVMHSPEDPAWSGYFRVIQSVAPSFGVEASPAGVHDRAEIDRIVSAFAHESNGGLIVGTSPINLVHSEEIISLAARYGLPAIYPLRPFARNGGLMCYGPDIADLYRGAASYVDRILRGEKPNDLPVQAPTKYELVINLKTAKALGLDVPLHLQQLADEVIE